MPLNVGKRPHDAVPLPEPVEPSPLLIRMPVDVRSAADHDSCAAGSHPDAAIRGGGDHPDRPGHAYQLRTRSTRGCARPRAHPASACRRHRPAGHGDMRRRPGVRAAARSAGHRPAAAGGCTAPSAHARNDTSQPPTAIQQMQKAASELQKAASEAATAPAPAQGVSKVQIESPTVDINQHSGVGVARRRGRGRAARDDSLSHLLSARVGRFISAQARQDRRTIAIEKENHGADPRGNRSPDRMVSAGRGLHQHSRWSGDVVVLPLAWPVPAWRLGPPRRDFPTRFLTLARCSCPAASRSSPSCNSAISG